VGKGEEGEENHGTGLREYFAGVADAVAFLYSSTSFNLYQYVVARDPLSPSLASPHPTSLALHVFVARGI
jgi:hypothetical protein